MGEGVEKLRGLQSVDVWLDQRCGSFRGKRWEDCEERFGGFGRRVENNSEG